MTFNGTSGSIKNMAKIIRESNREFIEEYSLHFGVNGDVRFGFDCDANGVVDVESLSPESRANYEACVSNPAFTSWVVDFSRTVWNPTVVECCGTTICCDSGHGNDCFECGAVYNTNGSRMAPRSQWGWETGERF